MACKATHHTATRSNETNEKVNIFPFIAISLITNLVSRILFTYHISILLFCCNAALRTTRGSPYVRMRVSFSFFAIYSKNLQATHASKFVILCNIFFADAPLKKKNFKNFVYEGVQHFLDTQVQNNFFALIKKIFLQTLVEIIFRYHKIFF